VNVTSSSLDQRPVIVFKDGTWNKLVLYNEGWGRVDAGKIHFGFTDPNNFAALDPRTAQTKFSAALKPFEVGTVLPLDNYFPPQKITLVKGRESETFEIPAHGEYCIYGVLEYTTGEEIDHRVFFKSRVHIGLAPLGMVSDSTAVYGIELKTGEVPQVKRVPISHSLKAGDVDSFQLTIAPDKSGVFSLDLSLQSVDGKDLGHKQVLIEAFVPRSERNKYKVEYK